jgi:hypothetical protein
MRGEGVFEDCVEDGAGTEDVELGAVDVVDLHALECLAHHLGIAEVLCAVGGERHRGAQRRDQAKVHEVRGFALDDDVVGLDVFVPEAAAVVAVEGLEEIGNETEGKAEAFLIEAVAATAGMQLLGDEREVLPRNVAHHVEEALAA